MLESLQQITAQELIDNLHDLKPEEAAVMTLLEKRLERERVQDLAKPVKSRKRTRPQAQAQTEALFQA